MPLVDPVADGLADQVRAERPAPELVPLQELADAAAVAVVGERPVDLEVVAPASKLEAVVAPAVALRRKIRKRQVGPLAGEQRDGTGRARHALRA